MPPPDSDEGRWFAVELQPHEALLRAWLRSRFSNSGEVDDIVQEAYMRVLRAHATGEVRSPKAFLFTTARNIALGQLRHKLVAKEDSLVDFDFSGILDESIDTPHAVARSQELELLTKAIQSLPPRCRQVITLRKIYGLSIKEVAAEMGITEHTVEIQGAIGLRKLADYFAQHDQAGPK